MKIRNYANEVICIYNVWIANKRANTNLLFCANFVNLCWPQTAIWFIYICVLWPFNVFDHVPMVVMEMVIFYTTQMSFFFRIYILMVNKHKQVYISQVVSIGLAKSHTVWRFISIVLTQYKIIAYIWHFILILILCKLGWPPNNQGWITEFHSKFLICFRDVSSFIREFKLQQP